MAQFENKKETATLEERRAARGERDRTRWIIYGAVGACLMFVGLIVAIKFLSGGKPKSPTAAGEVAAATGASPNNSNPSESQEVEPLIINDDGQSMWVSPTSGPPLELNHLPTGCQMIVALRPAAILATGEGDKILAALGPLGEQAVAALERTTGLQLTHIERLLVGIRPGLNFTPEIVLVVIPTDSAPQTVARDIYEPPSAAGAFVVVPPGVLDDIHKLAGAAPALRREMETLLALSDRDRHVTILVAPNFLFNDGRKMWSRAMADLRDPLFALLPDNARAVMLSLDWGDDFFAEVRAVVTVDRRPQDFARELQAKIAGWPAAAEQAVLEMTATPYSRQVVARLPAMLRTLTRYARAGRAGDHALLRVYLPLAAGHNLLMAGELMLHERLAKPTDDAVASTPSPALSVEDRLKKVTSLSFARDTLETAVQQLSDDIGVRTVIRGGDLQLDGITKNQSFGVNIQNRPAAEILLEVLRQANPDKTAAGPTDPKQKLVYTIGAEEGSTDQIVFITTRTQAEKRGDKLPAAFVE